MGRALLLRPLALALALAALPAPGVAAADAPEGAEARAAEAPAGRGAPAGTAAAHEEAVARLLDGLPPDERARARERLDRMPPARRERVLHRLERNARAWAARSPEEKEALRARLRRFRALPAAEQEALVRRRFPGASDAEQARILERLRRVGEPRGDEAEAGP
jgi:hypothetical protein